ncbi:MAG: hypothetical protein ABFS24_14080 [Pseudomonadota bacterium]
MDYTDDPDGTIYNELSNEYPNQHDYDQLVTIYAGSGKGGGADNGGGSCNPKSPRCNPASTANSHAQWGRLVSKHGGSKVITHVTWTLEHAQNHEH